MDHERFEHVFLLAHDTAPSGGAFVLVRGGSAVLSLNTPTSDADLFCIAAESDHPWIVRSLRAFPRLDLELRSTSWLDATCEVLDNYALPSIPLVPPISYWDLRFIARCAMGEVLAGCVSTYSRVEARREAIRQMARAHAAIEFVNIYEDLYGLWVEERYWEIRVRAGELIQAAARTAVQSRVLSDPSPKWAVPWAFRLSEQRMTASLSTCLSHLAEAGDTEGAWSAQLLSLARAVAAEAQLTRQDPNATSHGSPPDAELWWCPCCLDGCAVLDLRDRAVYVANLPFLESMTCTVAGEPRGSRRFQE